METFRGTSAITEYHIDENDMTLYNNKYKIESTRLQNWDYRNGGCYFVTICTKDRVCNLSSVQDGFVVLTQIGELVNECVNHIPNRHEQVSIDQFIIMPNHIHGIICIDSDLTLGEYKAEIGLKRNSLSSIINHFKGDVTKKVRTLLQDDFGWQSRFYERVIRDDKELQTVREYIVTNPLRWSLKQ